MADRFSTIKPGYSWFKRTLIGSIERFAKVNEAKAIYDDYLALQAETKKNTPSPMRFLVDRLGLSFDYRKSLADDLTPSGVTPSGVIASSPRGLLIISNHPFGLLDGLALSSIVEAHRPMSFVANKMLDAFPIFLPYIIGVDVINRHRAGMLTNLEAKRAIMSQLKAGRCVIIYPGGGMMRRRATIKQNAPRLVPVGGQIKEWWGLMTANIIHRTHCDVMLAHFPQRPSRAMAVAEKIHNDLSDALLLREVFAHEGARLKIHFSPLIPYGELAHLRDRIDLTNHLRRELKTLKE